MNEQRLCTLRELGRRLKRYGLTFDWLKTEAEAGRLPCLRAGRRLLFDADAVEAALIARAGQDRGEGVADERG